MDFQLNEDSLIPLYQQLMEDIKAALTEGKYAPDEKIPSESELSELYHVSRITVRRAVEELCSEGYLVKKQGKGTYVSQPKVIRKITQDKDVMGFSEACRACGMEPGAQVVNILRCPARSDEVRFLGLPPQSDVIFLQRVRTADGEPIMLENNFFPYEPFKGLLTAYEDLTNASLFDYLESRYGRRPESTVSCTLEIVRASSEQASYLSVITGDPMFYMNAYFLDGEGKPLLIGRQYIVGSRFVFNI